MVEPAQEPPLAVGEAAGVVDAADGEHRRHADAVDDDRRPLAAGVGAHDEHDGQDDRRRAPTSGATCRAAAGGRRPARSISARSSTGAVGHGGRSLAGRHVARRTVAAGAGGEAGGAGERLAAGDRGPAADRLVAHRRVLGEVPLLERRQPVVAHAHLRQGGELGGQRDAAASASPGRDDPVDEADPLGLDAVEPRPVRIRSMARLWPISRGRRTVPRSTSGTPKRRQ